MEKLTAYLVKTFALSLREAEVVYYVCKGWTNREVSVCLHVCEKTVKFHMTNILKKTQTKTRGRLITLCAGAVPENFPQQAPPKEITI